LQRYIETFEIMLVFSERFRKAFKKTLYISEIITDQHAIRRLKLVGFIMNFPL